MDLVIEWGKMMKLQLMKKTKDELKEIAKIYGVKGISKLNKEALCDEIMPVILSEVKNKVLTFDDKELELVKELVEKCEITDCDNSKEVYGFLQELGHVMISKDGVVTLAEEVRTEYKQCFNEKQDEVENQCMNVDYAKFKRYTLAAIHLYGALDVEKFKALYEKYENEILDIDTYVSWLSLGEEKSYKYINGYIASECLCLFENAGFKSLIQNTEGKDYYEPAKEEFMRYSDENYCEHTLHIERLKTHLKTMYKLDETTAEEAIFDLCLGKQITTKAGDSVLQHTLSQWTAMGITPRSREEINKLVTLIVNVMNSTRVWLYRGYTLDEINGVVNMPANKVKVGRNEACPCGSGKKYKKCCGR